ncbi:MAG: alpha/beta family hydrolase [Aestuariivirgaceae bacterium]
MPDFLIDGPQDGPCLILAHGAGAPMDIDFMNVMAGLIAAQGIGVMRFEFDYMARRRTTGKKAPPPKAERLIDEFKSAIAAAGVERPFIGGKSLGGRVASMCADELHAAGSIAGLVCLGYPFHPTGKPHSLRTAHLEDIACPVLIVQGERDPFGNVEEIAGYKLARAIGFHYAPFGDHDLSPPKRSGRTASDNWRDCAAAIGEFVKRVGADQAF